MKIKTYIFSLSVLLLFNVTLHAQSVLKTGTWAKVKTTESGVYKVTYDELVSMGFSSPQSVQLFGNGGSEFSLISTSELPSVLHEIAIWIEKGTDGVFNSGDYFLFYAQPSNSWTYDTINSSYFHTSNQFTSVNYYYITVNRNQPKTIQTIPKPSQASTVTINAFDDLYLYELNSINVLKSGRQWFEYFSTKNITFSIPNIVSSEKASVTLQLAGRHQSAADFSVVTNGVSQANIAFYETSNDNPYAVLKKQSYEFVPSSSNISIGVTANFSGIDSKAYLDYCELTVRSTIKVSNGQLQFRDSKSLADGAYGKFEIQSSANTAVWDITNPDVPTKQTVSYANSKYSFVANVSELHEYIAFTNSYKTVIFDSIITNQDLLSNVNIDMIIIANSETKAYAQEIASIHALHDGLKTVIVSQDEIFTEFSAGRPDISAIRNYLRYVYKQGGTLQYVLLFGDGSYNNTNYVTDQISILTFQSNQSLRSHSSFVSDDFFGLLDDNEGVDSNDIFIGELDIAIGRFPVNDATQAEGVTNKTIRYITDKGCRGEWQNYICMLADDADENQIFHMSDADKLVTNITAAYPNFNFEKIYLDAYSQLVRGAGQRYPDANTAISERMKKGCLVFNYTGHGSEVQMTAENVLNSTSIESWKNESKLPLFITASCEIAKFDNPELTSLGEKFIIQPDGGAIALFTTTRVVYAFSNYTLNNNIYKYLFTKDEEGKPISIGKAFLQAKQLSPNDFNQNKRNFTLLGDPALRLAVPEYSISIDSLNQIESSIFEDTIHSNSVVTVHGSVYDYEGNFLPAYNGTVYIKLFDKSQKIETLGNDGSDIFEFQSMKNILFQGKASIINGMFNFEMIIPQDILYYSGKGKLSVYSTNDVIQGAGNFKFEINGSNPDYVVDTDGPEIQMYMNDTLFVSGNVTHAKPTLLVQLFDISGINISDAAIGHSISIIIDGDEYNTILLNEFYSANLNTYKYGAIEYPFSELEEGMHTITIKVWDTQNNVTEKTISFLVIGVENVVLQKLYSFPNPMKQNGITFHFEHNQSDEDITATIRIFDIAGNCVKIISKTYNPTGFIEEGIYWDGKTSGGNYVEKGVYSYIVEINSQYGKEVLGQQKIIVLQ